MSQQARHYIKSELDLLKRIEEKQKVRTLEEEYGPAWLVPPKGSH